MAFFGRSQNAAPSAEQVARDRAQDDAINELHADVEVLQIGDIFNDLRMDQITPHP